jgi:hypothetical protein
LKGYFSGFRKLKGKLNFDVLEYFLTTNSQITIQIVNDELCHLKCKVENLHINCLKGIIFITAGERSIAGGEKTDNNLCLKGRILKN